MFSIDKYFSSSFQEEQVDLVVKDETFCVRRLNGLDLIYLSEAKNAAQKIILILANCLFDGKTDKPIGTENAMRFVREHLLLAMEIATRIAELGNELEHAEKHIKRNARENF